MTAQAMGGVVTFQESLAARLGIMSPSAQIVEEFLSSHPPRISPGTARFQYIPNISGAWKRDA